MKSKKRGLGRGLEALLAETSDKDEGSQPSTGLADHLAEVIAPHNPGTSINQQSPSGSQAEDQSALAIALVKKIQKENLLLQEEAMALKSLLEEFEQMLRQE
jgi:hypothetical protein